MSGRCVCDEDAHREKGGGVIEEGSREAQMVATVMSSQSSWRLSRGTSRIRCRVMTDLVSLTGRQSY